MKLDKVGDAFEKEVQLPLANEKILYKFVVNGDQWVADDAAPKEYDGHFNVNNVLYPEDIQNNEPVTISSAAPGSISASLAGQVPFLSAPEAQELELEWKISPPGAFPEASANEQESFSVQPIPAISGIGNPVNLAPRGKVPDPSTITSTIVDSNATKSKEGYERDASAALAVAAGVVGGAALGAAGPSAFMKPEEKENLIPFLPIGTSATDTLDAGPTTSSAAPTSTTAQLAAGVPLEKKRQAMIIHPADAPSSDSSEPAGSVPGTVFESRNDASASIVPYEGPTIQSFPGLRLPATLNGTPVELEKWDRKTTIFASPWGSYYKLLKEPEDKVDRDYAVVEVMTAFKRVAEQASVTATFLSDADVLVEDLKSACSIAPLDLASISGSDYLQSRTKGPIGFSSRFETLIGGIDGIEYDGFRERDGDLVTAMSFRSRKSQPSGQWLSLSLFGSGSGRAVQPAKIYRPGSKKIVSLTVAGEVPYVFSAEWKGQHREWLLEYNGACYLRTAKLPTMMTRRANYGYFSRISRIQGANRSHCTLNWMALGSRWLRLVLPAHSPCISSITKDTTRLKTFFLLLHLIQS